MTDSESIRAKSLKFLEDENLSYQSVALPGDVATAGHDRSYMSNILFGDDIRGRSLLDIGSYLGYFCIEAMRRGASEAHGIETDITNVRQARKIAELWDLSAHYTHGNFEDWHAEGKQYDVVACLNVLHHLYDPIHALRKMMAIARSRIVLEIAVPTLRDVMRDKINPLRLFNVGAPAIFLGIPRKRGDAAGRTYLFTPKALEIVFNTHTTIFEPVKIATSPFKGRVIIAADKRRIDHLVVVSGPTSSGKSTFAGRLETDPELRRRFGLEDGEWRTVQASEIASLPSVRHERLILHYDFLRPSRTGMRSHDRDPALHLMKVAGKTTILTIIAPRSRIVSQLQKGEIAREGRKARQRDLDLLELYKKPHFLKDWYTAWTEFCNTCPAAARTLVLNDDDFRPVPVENWGKVLES